MKTEHDLTTTHYVFIIVMISLSFNIMTSSFMVLLTKPFLDLEDVYAMVNITVCTVVITYLWNLVRLEEEAQDEVDRIKL